MAICSLCTAHGGQASHPRMKSEYYGEYYEHENSHWWFRWRFDMITQIVDALPKSDHFRLLDAGCGTGQMTKLLERYGEAVGLEIAPEAIASARRRKYRPGIDRGPALRGWVIRSRAIAGCDRARRQRCPHPVEPLRHSQAGRSPDRDGSGIREPLVGARRDQPAQAPLSRAAVAADDDRRRVRSQPDHVLQ